MDVYGLLVIKQYFGSTSIFAPLKKGEGRDDLLPPPPLSAVPTVIPIIIITVIGVPVKKNRGGAHFCPTHPKVSRRVKNESKYRLIVA